MDEAAKTRVARRTPEVTRALLVAAAQAEFAEVGYEATQSNRIAERAGFAPQTFYRHFTDKLAILLAVYDAWKDGEFSALEKASSSAQAARELIEHHRQSRRLRRTLRYLSVAEPRIRAARAESRRQQVGRLGARFPAFAARPLAEQMATLLVIERLADAGAEAEFEDLGLSVDDVDRALRKVLRAEVLGLSSQG